MRETIVAEARRWIGTPYRHACALPGLGCDCLGLIVGVRRAVFGPGSVPPVASYPPDWAVAGSTERLVEALAANLPERAAEAMWPGDVLVLRWRGDRPASHAALLTGEGTIIHAHAGASVCEIALLAAWRRRIAAVFSFPEYD